MSVRPPLREQVYRSIRNDLMSGQIAPSERLGEERLAHLYGVSRTPVREALAKLESDGLVERDEHGLFPYRPHLDELGGLYELRILLEVTDFGGFSMVKPPSMTKTRSVPNWTGGTRFANRCRRRTPVS